MDLIKVVEQAFANEKVATYPKFKAGDTVTVTYRIAAGEWSKITDLCRSALKFFK